MESSTQATGPKDNDSPRKPLGRDGRPSPRPSELIAEEKRASDIRLSFHKTNDSRLQMAHEVINTVDRERIRNTSAILANDFQIHQNKKDEGTKTREKN